MERGNVSAACSLKSVGCHTYVLRVAALVHDIVLGDYLFWSRRCYFFGHPNFNGYRRFLFAPCAWHSLSLALPTLVPPYSSVPGANVSPPISLSDIIRTPCHRNFVRKQNAPPNKDDPTFIKLVRLPPEEETTKQLSK